MGAVPSILSRWYTLQGTNISHLGKRKIIFKMPFLGGYVSFLEGISFQSCLVWTTPHLVVDLPVTKRKETGDILQAQFAHHDLCSQVKHSFLVVYVELQKGYISVISVWPFGGTNTGGLFSLDLLVWKNQFSEAVEKNADLQCWFWLKNHPKQIQAICSKIPELHQKAANSSRGPLPPLLDSEWRHSNDPTTAVPPLARRQIRFRVFGKELAIVFVPSLALPGVNRMKLQTSKEQRGRFEAYKSQNQNNERGVVFFFKLGSVYWERIVVNFSQNLPSQNATSAMQQIHNRSRWKWKLTKRNTKCKVGLLPSISRFIPVCAI